MLCEGSKTGSAATHKVSETCMALRLLAWRSGATAASGSVSAPVIQQLLGDRHSAGALQVVRRLQEEAARYQHRA